MLSNKVLPTSMTICLPMKELASSFVAFEEGEEFADFK